MWVDAGFIELSVGLGFRASIVPLPEHATMRAANCAMDEKMKKEKDDKEARWGLKQWARLNQGKRWQGLEEEEEEEQQQQQEEEQGEGSGSLVQWDELGGGDGFGSPMQWDEVGGKDEDQSL